MIVFNIRKGEGEYNFTRCLCKVVSKLCCHDDITTVKSLQTEASNFCKLFTQEYQNGWCNFTRVIQDRRLESAEQHFNHNLDAIYWYNYFYSYLFFTKLSNLCYATNAIK